MCPRTSLMTRDISWIDKDLFESVLDQITPHDEERLDEFWKFIKDTYGITFDQRNENTFYFHIVSRCVILHGYGEPLIDKNITKRVQAIYRPWYPNIFLMCPRKY